jgi:hypothetical protein
MSFLNKEDYFRKIKESILNQITGGNDDLLDEAETTAAGIITDMLSGNYNIAAELAKNGDARHENLKYWMLNLSAYLLYDRIPDNEVPERITNDFDATMDTLRKIAIGRTPTTLTPVIDGSGKTKRVFRMGSKPPRGHNLIGN